MTIHRVLLGSVQLAVGQQIISDAWRKDMELRAAKVKKYREYIDSEHDFDWLSDEQRTALNIAKGEEFSVNHCENILRVFADRLHLTAIEGEDNDASEWAANLLKANRFDALQLDVHEACPRDGDTYVMVSFNNETGKPELTHEPAFDGIDGMMVVYARTQSDDILCALKLWHEVIDSSRTRTRLNVYYEDRIEKLETINGGAWNWAYDPDEAYVEEGTRRYIPWLMPDREPIGVPVVHFRNHKRSRGGYGLSVLEAAIPVQDGLNRTAQDLIASGQFSAFQLRYVLGVEAPKKVAPGMFLEIVPRDKDGKVLRPDAATAEWLKAVKIGAIEPGAITPHLEAAMFWRDQMYQVTGTPDYNRAGANASGESLKQMESQLIGRLKRAHAYWGNAWEDALRLGARVQEAFGEGAAVSDVWRAQWVSAEPRNDTQVIDNALKVEHKVSEREFLRMIAPVYGWDEAKIEEIIAERQRDRSATIAAAGAFMPRFNSADETEIMSDGRNGTDSRTNEAGAGATGARTGEPGAEAGRR